MALEGAIALCELRSVRRTALSALSIDAAVLVVTPLVTRLRALLTRHCCFVGTNRAAFGRLGLPPAAGFTCPFGVESRLA